MTITVRFFVPLWKTVAGLRMTFVCCQNKLFWRADFLVMPKCL
jgi:hypothetical protein